MLSRHRNLAVTPEQRLAFVTLLSRAADDAGSGWRHYTVRLERGPRYGPWFSWAVVDAGAIAGLAAAAGLELLRLQPIATEGRWFAHLGRVSPEERSSAVA